MNWIHRKCNGTSNKEYDLLVLEDDSTRWQCILSDIEEMAAKFPFIHSTNMELNDLYGLDFPSQLQLLPSYELRSKLSHIPTLNDFDIDENYVQTISSKYYDISEFSEFQSSKNKYFSLFHVNARNLSKNFDQLLSVLTAIGISFDVLGTTETKEQIGKAFTTNVNIDEYHMYTQPTKSAAGGVAIYVNNKLDHFERKDLSILHEEFESIWVEMKNIRGNNFLCGSIYRHPNTDISHFIEYVEATLSKINKNKYNVFLMGDFNIDFYNMNLTVTLMIF